MNHYEPDAQRPEVVNPSTRIKPLVLLVNVEYSDSCLRVPSLMEKQEHVSYGETILFILPITSRFALSITEFSSAAR